MTPTITDPITALATWIWGRGSGNYEGDEGEEDDNKKFSAEICMSQLPFLSIPCFSQLISKGLGLAIIAGSCLNKVPIMINMLTSKSAAGISRNSLYGEAIVYANGALYGYLFSYPFTSYGENVSLLIQNIILIIMAWQLSRQSPSSSRASLEEQVSVIVGFFAYLVAILQFLQKDYYYLLLSATWPVMLYARGSQVYETFFVKHTGNLSVVTTSMNLVGSLIRIGTTIQETGDVIVLVGYMMSGALSFIMFIQYWLYLPNTIKALEEEKKQRQDIPDKKIQ
jgi:mannose-P-dolichol utilization defect protein 1